MLHYFGKSSIERAVSAGRLHRTHVGVFAVGHLAPGRLGEWHGDVLAAGDDAVLSIRCASTLMKIREGVGPRTDVTIPPGSHRRRPGIDLHRMSLLPFEVGTWANIPITSPARTMVDLAHHLGDRDDIEWALRELQHRRLYDRELLELSNLRRPNRHLGALLAGPLAPTGSPLEVAFMNRVVRRHGLPEPICQALLLGMHVDFLWAEARLVVEVDGRNHDLPMMRFADAHRDALLAAAGYLVCAWRLRHP